MQDSKSKTLIDDSIKKIPTPLPNETKSTPPEAKKTVEDAPVPGEEQAP